jgi:hypothetical protein
VTNEEHLYVFSSKLQDEIKTDKIELNDLFWNVGQANCILKYFVKMMIDHSDSFTKVSETQYTVIVTPSLGGKHSNVAITVAANAFTDTVTKSLK